MREGFENAGFTHMTSLSLNHLGRRHRAEMIAAMAGTAFGQGADQDRLGIRAVQPDCGEALDRELEKDLLARDKVSGVVRALPQARRPRARSVSRAHAWRSRERHWRPNLRTC